MRVQWTLQRFAKGYPKINFLYRNISMDYRRSNKAQVLFTANYYDAFECLETCPKYNRARASLFSDETEMAKLLTFVANTTTDPVTETFYKDITASQVWLGMR